MPQIGLRTKYFHLKNRLRKAWYGSIHPDDYEDVYEFEHVLCGVTHNEAGILEEWVLFHLSVGVDRIILYDDKSTDGSRELLKPYEEAGKLEWRVLDAEKFSMWEQIKAYNRALKDYRGRARWMWFLDTDEFLVPSKVDTISEVTSEIEKDPEVGGIAVNWLFFGTGHVDELEKGEWHIEKLTQRAQYDWQSHWVTKCGLRPEASAGFFENPHWAVMYKDRHLVYADGKEYNGEHVDHSQLRVHHYWHRTEKFYREVKIGRQKKLMGKEFVEKSYDERARKLHYDAHNQVEDRRMLDFIPEMQALKEKYRNQ